MYKNHKLILFFTFFSLIGSETFIFALSFKLLNDYKSAVYYSLFLIIYSIIHILLSPFIGRLTDTKNKFNIIVISQIITIIYITIYIFIPNSLLNLTSIFILLAGLTITDLTVSLALNSGLLKIVGDSLIEKTISNKSAIEKTVSIISPMIGGVAYAFIPLNYFLYLMLFTEIFSLICIIFISFPRFNKQKDINLEYEKKNQKNYKVVLDYFRVHKDIMTLIMLGIYINFLLSFLNVGIATSFIKYFNMSASNLGFMQVFTPIGMIIIAIIYPFIKIKSNVFKQNSQGLFIVCLAIIILIIPFFLENNSFIIILSFISARLLLGIGVQYTNIPSIIYMQKNIPENIKGSFFGIVNSSIQSTVPLGFLLAGILFDINSIFYVILFSISGLLSVILAFYSLNYSKYFTK